MKLAGQLIIYGSQPLTAIPLVAGWNLVGYDSQTARAIADCTVSIAGKCSSVSGYKSNQWLWYFPDEPSASNLSGMEPAVSAESRRFFSNLLEIKLEIWYNTHLTMDGS